MNVKLEGVEETMLIPLWARAYETTKVAKPLIVDKMAVEMVDKIDYDFNKFNGAKLSQVGTATRSTILDREAGNFIKEHTDAVCINLCSGLDTRFYRIGTPNITWYNIDLPDVMKLRRQLLPQEPENVHNIAGSILDARTFANISTQGRPVLLIMEGASMYFTEAGMASLLRLLHTKFPAAVMLVEIMPPFLIKQQKHHDTLGKCEDAHFSWGIKDGKEIEQLNSEIRFCQQWTLYEGFRKRWGIMGLLSWIPWWNNNCNDKIVKLIV